MSVISAPPLMTIDEIARVLRLHPLSVRKRIRAGQLQAVRLGTGPSAPVRVERTELDRYLEESRHRAA